MSYDPKRWTTPEGALGRQLKLIEETDHAARALRKLEEASGLSWLRKLEEQPTWMIADTKWRTELPPALQQIEDMSARIRQLTALPPALQQIEDMNARIRRLTELPPALRQFEDMNARIRQLTELPPGLKAFSHVDEEFRRFRNFINHSPSFGADVRDLVSELFEPDEDAIDLPTLAVNTVIVPEKPVAEGVLIQSTSLVWTSVIRVLKRDWSQAYQIPYRVWEEIVAGAFKEYGFDEVILTPRSGDHGRDLIATRKEVGSVRLIGSVKAYKPGHLITKEEVHALLGVVAADRNASKGLIATTSDFAPRLLDDPNLAACVPHRIELMNGKKLQRWLMHLLSEQHDQHGR